MPDEIWIDEDASDRALDKLREKEVQENARRKAAGLPRTRLSWSFLQEEFRDVLARARTYPRPSVVLVIAEVAERVVFSPWRGPRAGIVCSPWAGPLDAVPDQYPYLKPETLEKMNRFDFPMVIVERHFDGSHEEMVFAIPNGD
jgi:hypothetical protein